MKLVMAVISNKDVSKVLDAITKEGFASTRISTTGQFLADGHTTLFIGTEDHKVEQLFDVLKKHVTKRVVRQAGVASTLNLMLVSGEYNDIVMNRDGNGVDVEEYGAVAFVINVDEFRKL